MLPCFLSKISISLRFRRWSSSGSSGIIPFDLPIKDLGVRHAFGPVFEKRFGEKFGEKFGEGSEKLVARLAEKLVEGLAERRSVRPGTGRLWHCERTTR